MMNHSTIAHWFYRLAIVFCFLGFGLWELVRPDYWVAYAPGFVSSIGNPATLVFVHGIVLTAVAVGLLIPRLLKVSAILAVLILIEICATVWFTIGFGDIFIRDVALLLFTCGFVAEVW